MMKKHHIIILCIPFLLFGILYWWNLPQYRFHCVRVHCFHVVHDLMEIEAALEYYYNDHHCYPPAVTLDGRFQISSDVVSIGYIPEFITSCTPASTLDLALDLFSYKDKMNYRYGTNSQDRWILISRGPDKTEDMDERNIREQLTTPKEEWEKRLYVIPEYSYDPTNGTFSAGEIFRKNNVPGIKNSHQDILKRRNKYYDPT